MSVVVSGVLCRFKLALPSLLFLLYNGRSRSAQPWPLLITGITVSLGRLLCDYFKNTSGGSSSEESSSEDESDPWLFNDQSDKRHREFCRIRQLSTALHKNNKHAKRFGKIEAQFERVALFSDLGKLSSFCCTASVQSCVVKFPLRTVWMKTLEMKTTQK